MQTVYGEFSFSIPERRRYKFWQWFKYYEMTVMNGKSGKSIQCGCWIRILNSDVEKDMIDSFIIFLTWAKAGQAKTYAELCENISKKRRKIGKYDWEYSKQRAKDAEMIEADIDKLLNDPILWMRAKEKL